MMKNMTLKNIAEACHGTLLTVNGQKPYESEITGVVIDSRKCAPGNLFVAIPGSRVDGHKFVPQVLNDGAAAAVVEKMPSEVTGTLILVKSTEEALGEIAAYYRSSLDITVVGVTGSVGKTSTKETIAAVLSKRYRVLSTEGNFNNKFGLPLTIFRLTEDTEVAVLEMGISDFGEMTYLSGIAKPDIAVITNIGECHLEFLGDRNGVLKAKTEIFSGLKENGRVVLNGDDDKLRTVREVNGEKPLFFGTDNVDSVFAADINPLGLDGIEMKLSLPEEKEMRDVTIHVPGKHNVYNALAGASVGYLLGMTPEEITAGIESYRTIGGRSNVIRTEKLTILDDCYNANPVSMKEAIETLSFAKGRRIAVLGDMGELGEKEKELHREVGTFLSGTGIEAVFCAGTLMKSLEEEVRSLSPEKNVFYFETKKELLEKLLAFADTGDTILVKASHFMEYPEIVEKLKEL